MFQQERISVECQPSLTDIRSYIVNKFKHVRGAGTLYNGGGRARALYRDPLRIDSQTDRHD